MATREFSDRERIIDSPVPDNYEQVTVIPEGPYKLGATIRNVETVKAKTSTNDKCGLWICFDDGNLKGKAIRQEYSLTKDGMDKLKDDMRTLGVIDDQPEGKKFSMSDEEINKRLEGIKGIPVFFTDSYKGVNRSKLEWPGFITEEEAEKYVPKSRSSQAPLPDSSMDEDF